MGERKYVYVSWSAWLALASASCSGGSSGLSSPDASVEPSTAPATSDEARSRVALFRTRFVVKPTALPARPTVDEAAPTAHPVIAEGVVDRFERLDANRVQPIVSELAKKGVTKRASVVLPTIASHAVELEDDASHVAVRFALERATDARLELADGIAVYRGALDGADVVHRVHAEGTEDFVVFEAKPARESLAYRVDVSRVAGVRLVGSVLELLDSGGTPRLRVAPPYVVDANGARREASLTIEGCAYDANPAPPWGRAVTPAGSESCVVRVAWSGVEYPAIVDPSWVATGSMASGRSSHSASVLATSGRVLVAGGANGTWLSLAELYDPTTATFAATGTMASSRSGYSVSVLGTGKVLVAGGYNYIASVNNYLSLAELYDPTTGIFPAMTGPMLTGRSAFVAMVLSTGKVLVAGGSDAGGLTSVLAELYNPATGFFTATGSMGTARGLATGTLLTSGKVLVAGRPGSLGSTAELYDPLAGTFAAAAPMLVARYSHTATRLASGKVLIAGGSAYAFAELYDPATNTFTMTGAMATKRYGHTASLLSSGLVLVAGGWKAGGAVAPPDVYDPSTGTFSPTGPMTTAERSDHTASVLASGKVLVAGAETVTRGALRAPRDRRGLRRTGRLHLGQLQRKCCTAACTGPCKTCNGAGACLTVTNADDPDTCTGANTCDATGVCRLKAGQLCPDAASCASGVCDGTCCTKACTATCTSCDGTGACALTGLGKLGTSCTDATRTCDGAGACKLREGQPCTAPSDCAYGRCNALGVCDAKCTAACTVRSGAGAGTCVPVTNKDDPGLCSGTKSCDAAGVCRLKNGQPATVGSTCVSGFTCDGVCCNSACSACQACTAARKGSGVDGVVGPLNCGTYLCQAGTTTCKTTCAADTDCAATAYCNASACVPRTALATACTADNQCLSGHCADGVCCTETCSGNCFACTAAKSGVAGSDGTCTAVTNGLTGRGECGASTCSGALQTSNVCNGAGGCRAVSTPCAPFACDASGKVCATSCTLDTDCGATGFCASGTCAPRVKQGEACTTSNQCPRRRHLRGRRLLRDQVRRPVPRLRGARAVRHVRRRDREPSGHPRRLHGRRQRVLRQLRRHQPRRLCVPDRRDLLRRGVLRRQALGVRRRGQLPHRLSVRRQPHVREPDEVQGLLRGRQRLREGLRVRGGKVRDDAAAEVLGRRPLVDPLRRNRCTLRALSVRHDRRLQEAVHDHRRLRARQRVRHRGEAVRPRRNRAERLGRVRAHSRWFGERKRPRCWARPRGGRAHASAARS
ncbi:MAG: hypothetical protein IPJ34_40335 [Myxococcales bacterium]|nr:hypothetical protein [Myxococcales bacterium]